MDADRLPFKRASRGSDEQDQNEGATDVSPPTALLEVLLTDAGLLEDGEDPVAKTRGVAGMLDALADYLGVHEPQAVWSIALLRDAASEVLAHAMMADGESECDFELRELEFDGFTFRPRREGESP